MIELILQNNSAFVYKVTDWEILRRQYRIIGEILGSTQHIPALPICLLPEEALLLINKGIARLVSYEHSCNIEIYNDLHRIMFKNLLEEEKKIYKEIRKTQISSYIDTIVEGKRKKGDFRTKTEIFNDEIERTCDVTEENIIWPVLTQTFQEIRGNPIVQPKETLMAYTDCIKIAIYADLWEKGYYITSGDKFGGDFLLYKGDPLICHAIYIVRCLKSPSEKLHCSEVVSLGRLGTSVKKRAIFATLHKDGVKYITINWLEA